MEIELDDLQFFVISFKEWVRHREVIFFIYQTIVCCQTGSSFRLLGREIYNLGETGYGSLY